MWLKSHWSFDHSSSDVFSFLSSLDPSISVTLALALHGLDTVSTKSYKMIILILTLKHVTEDISINKMLRVEIKMSITYMYFYSLQNDFFNNATGIPPPKKKTCCPRPVWEICHCMLAKPLKVTCIDFLLQYSNWQLQSIYSWHPNSHPLYDQILPLIATVIICPQCLKDFCHSLKRFARYLQGFHQPAKLHNGLRGRLNTS